MTKLAEKLMPPEEFDAAMIYFPTRAGNSREIAHAYHVLGQPASIVALEFGCTKQNVVKVLARFAKAYERYNQVRRNLKSADVRAQAAAAESVEEEAPAPAPAKKAVATKRAAPAKSKK